MYIHKGYFCHIITLHSVLFAQVVTCCYNGGKNIVLEQNTDQVTANLLTYLSRIYKSNLVTDTVGSQCAIH